jgi:hypothetical protein
MLIGGNLKDILIVGSLDDDFSCPVVTRERDMENTKAAATNQTRGIPTFLFVAAR